MPKVPKSNKGKERAPKADLGFVRTNLDDLRDESESPATKSLTKSHITLFKQYLVEIQALPDTLLPEDIIKDTLASYLVDFISGVKIRNANGIVDYQPTSLQGIYASIRRYLNSRNYGDIGKMTNFDVVRDTLKRVCKRLKKNGGGDLSQATSPLTPKEIDQVFCSRAAGRHNPRALINGLCIACMFLGFRGGKELRDRRVADLKVITVDGTRYLTIAKERVSKTRNGENPRDTRSGIPKLKEIPDSPDRCPVLLFLKFLSKRPTNMLDPESPLFIRPWVVSPIEQYSELHQWYYNVPMGLNEIGKLVKNMIKSAEVDTTGRKIANTSLRKTTSTSLMQAGLGTKVVMQQLGHRNPQSLTRYDVPTKVTTDAVTDILYGHANSSTLSTPHPTVRAPAPLPAPLPQRWNIGVQEALNLSQAGPSTAPAPPPAPLPQRWDIGVQEVLNLSQAGPSTAYSHEVSTLLTDQPPAPSASENAENQAAATSTSQSIATNSHTNHLSIRNANELIAKVHSLFNTGNGNVNIGTFAMHFH